LAVKHKLVNTEVCGAVLEYLKDKKQPQYVNHVWNVVNEQNVPISVGILEVIYDTYADAGDVSNIKYLNI
jgi:hypothetical protein